jgi:prophage regulatory protein
MKVRKPNPTDESNLSAVPQPWYRTPQALHHTLPRPLKMDRFSDVEKRRGVSRSQIYSEISQELWPKPAPIGARAVGWPDYESDAVIAARIAGKTDEEIRALVRQLEAARKTLA